MKLELQIESSNGIVTICGENNTGKTNALRAIDLFFNPDKYSAATDAPHHKYKGTRGGAVFPEVTLDFVRNDSELFSVTQAFGIDGLKPEHPKGYKCSLDNKRSRQQLASSEISEFLKELGFFFIESINVSFPELISNLVENDLYDIEFAKARLRGFKKNLMTFYKGYTSGLLEVLNDLAEEINPRFREFKEDWGIGFQVEENITRFRDLISDDIKFFINDRSSTVVEAKGSGLQRLACLLLYFRIIEKIRTKSVILMIDEPDVFLHQGLEAKLYEHLLDLAERAQIMVTTHSPIFIDSYTLKNVFLLELDITEKDYTRAGRRFAVLNTKLVDTNKTDGARKIREYLGIKDIQYDLLDPYNILVEGTTDKTYIENLIAYFKLGCPNIVAAEGASQVKQRLDFYNTFYKKRRERPRVLVLLDNDSEGRTHFKEVFQKAAKGKYGGIDVRVLFVPTCRGESPDETNLTNVDDNHEIEDFIYPGVVCYLANEILKARDLAPVDPNRICARINKPAHKQKGLLYLIENEKNEVNPDTGQEIDVGSPSFKGGMASKFSVEGNRKIIGLLELEQTSYPEVRSFLEQLTNPDAFWAENEPLPISSV